MAALRRCKSATSLSAHHLHHQRRLQNAAASPPQCRNVPLDLRARAGGDQCSPNAHCSAAPPPGPGVINRLEHNRSEEILLRLSNAEVEDLTSTHSHLSFHVFAEDAGIFKALARLCVSSPSTLECLGLWLVRGTSNREICRQQLTGPFSVLQSLTMHSALPRVTLIFDKKDAIEGEPNNPLSAFGVSQDGIHSLGARRPRMWAIQKSQEEKRRDFPDFSGGMRAAMPKEGLLAFDDLVETEPVSYRDTIFFLVQNQQDTAGRDIRLTQWIQLVSSQPDVGQMQVSEKRVAVTWSWIRPAKVYSLLHNRLRILHPHRHRQVALISVGPYALYSSSQTVALSCRPAHSSSTCVPPPSAPQQRNPSRLPPTTSSPPLHPLSNQPGTSSSRSGPESIYDPGNVTVDAFNACPLPLPVPLPSSSSSFRYPTRPPAEKTQASYPLHSHIGGVGTAVK
uniref:Uncharacterized protein n=1 Tax=Mycena chlorophos TaxID=658473 RepID=A0ABQ0KW66_MYCCL|nr:predicted protein [Mycena chlorophos]